MLAVLAPEPVIAPETAVDGPVLASAIEPADSCSTQKYLVSVHPQVTHSERVALAQTGKAFDEHYAAWWAGKLAEHVDQQDWDRSLNQLVNTRGPFELCVLLRMLPAKRSLQRLLPSYASTSFPILDPAAVAAWLWPAVLKQQARPQASPVTVVAFCTSRTFTFRNHASIDFPDGNELTSRERRKLRTRLKAHILQSRFFELRTFSEILASEDDRYRLVSYIFQLCQVLAMNGSFFLLCVYRRHKQTYQKC